MQIIQYIPIGLALSGFMIAVFWVIENKNNLK